MKPREFSGSTVVIAKNQPPYLPLPAHLSDEGIVTTCWGLTWKERVIVLCTGRLWWQTMTFGKPLQPQRPSATNPIESAS